MNVKKLSLASLLLMACSFGWAETSTFVKVTSVNQLVPGNKYLFVVAIPEGSNVTDANGFAISNITNKKRMGAKVNIISSPVDEEMEIIETEIDANGKPYALTLGGDATNGFTFYDNVNQGYIAAPSSQGNTFDDLEHDDDLDGKGKWEIVYMQKDNAFDIHNWADKGKWIICRHPGNQGMPAFVASKDGYIPAYLFVEYSALETITLARSNKGDDLNYYATAYFDKDMKLDKNIAAYDVVPVPTTPGNQVLNLEKVVEKGEILYANSPVILRLPNEDPEADPYVDYPIYTLATTNPDMIETNLVGTLEDIDAPENSYKLRKQAIEVTDETGETEEVGTVAFFKAAGTTILANKAYYVLGEAAEEGEETGEVKVLTFSFSSATGIEKVNTPQELNGAIYNLAGQQVNKNYRGIVLKNGKKFLNK